VRARVLDIGTGSGCIAIALKQRAPLWQVTGLDISPDALEIAKKNATRNNIQVDWIQIDILNEELKGDFDIIVSNPPYICDSEKIDMEARVLDYEPHSALFVPDNDPLLFYRRIADLKPSLLFFEINEAYGEAVCAMMKEKGYTNIELKNDIYGKPRMVFGAINRQG
jgi:release factor glutamine methyltransferase